MTTSCTPLLQTPPSPTSSYGSSNQRSDVQSLVDEALGIIPKPQLTWPQFIAKYSVYAVGVVASAVAKIFFIPISLVLPGGWGVAGATGNTCAFFVLEFWAFRKFVDKTFDPVSEARKKIYGENKVSAGNCIRVISAFIIGLICQIAAAFAAAKYDRKYGESVAVSAFTVTGMAGSFFPALSVNETLKSTSCCKQHPPAVASPINAIRNKLVNQINNFRDAFSKMSGSERANLFRNLESLKTLPNFEEDFVTFLEVCTRNTAPVKAHKPGYLRKIGDTVISALSWVVIAFFHVAIGLYVYSGTRKWYDNKEPVAYVVAGLSGLTSAGAMFYQSRLSIQKTFQRIYRSILNTISGKGEKSLAEQAYPKICKGIKSVAILTDIVALAPTYVIWGKYFDKHNPGLPDLPVISETIMCAAIFSLIVNAMLDTINDIGSASLLRYQQFCGHDWVVFDHHLSELQELLNTLPEEALARLIPTELSKRLLSDQEYKEMTAVV